MDVVREKARDIISKLQTKYGVQTKTLVGPVKRFVQEEEGGGQSEEWYLVDGKNHKFRLPKTMLFLGKEECDFVVQCSCVDKRHAVITYDHYLSRFKIKDLSTKHGTYVNETKIPEQEYVTLNHMDSVQLGHDSVMIYQMEKGSSAAENEILPSTKTRPVWAVQSDLQMAECQGCIAEHKIMHTCTHSLLDEKSTDMQNDFDSSSSAIRENVCSEEPVKEQNISVPNNGCHRSDDNFTESSEQAIDSVQNSEPYFNQVSTSVFDNNKHNESSAAPGYSEHIVSVSAQTSAVPRISRSSGSMQTLPPELSTVKKCTPLYGQPEWWGEAEPNHGDSSRGSGNGSASHKDEIANKSTDHSERPQCLCLEENNQLKMEKYKTDPKYSTIYMEIPHTDIDVDKDKQTPSSTSSVSKDSLFLDASKKNTPDTPSDKVVARRHSGSDESGHTGDVSGMAFTVDFGDDKKLDMSLSLSEFVPSKIRKSFRERMEKVTKPQNRDGNSSKSEETNGHSPTQQKKTEDIWNSSENHKASKKQGRKSWPPHVSSSKNGTRVGGSPQLTNPAKEEEKISKHNTVMKNSKVQQRVKKAPNSKDEKLQKSSQPELSSVDSSTMSSDSVSFLIDKMFQTSSPVSSSTSSRVSDKNTTEQLTEHDLYQESKKYDTERSHMSFNDSLSPNEKFIENYAEKQCRRNSKEGEEDKVSEAGTYTIETDLDNTEEEIARKNIDEIFGLNLDRPVITNELSGVQGERQAIVTTSCYTTWSSSLEVNAGSAEDAESPEKVQDLDMSAVSANDIPKWISQWAALANDRTLTKTQSLDIPVTEGNAGSQRKKTGCGRKLPTIPCKKESLDSSRTSGSMDTEVLLQDTKTVMAAMEARMATRTAKDAVAMNGFNHSDNSDTDSNVAIVNGDDDFKKPSYFESPRQNLAKEKTPVKGSVNKPLSSKPPLIKTSNVIKDNISADSFDTDTQRSFSSGSPDSTVSKGSSAPKGTITMQKSNRAFQLRRTKSKPLESSRSSYSETGSSSSVTTSRTRTTSGSTTQRTTSASSTVRSSMRTKSGGHYDSGKSEISLGAEIVKRSQQNIKFVRADGGRHSLRSFKSNSEKTLVPIQIDSGRKAELKVLKNQLKTKEVSRGLAVTGQVTGQKVQSQSQPGSRTNSPKAAERLAWKRRKEYDPRKAVAEAKAKAKEGVTNKSRCDSSSSSSSATIKQTMVRSSSFTNTARLRHETYRADSTSSTEDINQYEKEIFSRAFIPVHKTFRSDRLFHSADEDESSLAFHSTQELSRSMISSLEHKSAFTTLSPKQKTPSPEKSPTLSSLSSRRHTLNSLLYQEQIQNHIENGRNATQSYNTLIISSIYQLSLKLKTASDRTINKLRENDRVSVTPSPVDDFLSDSATSEIPAWKSVNQELAGILKNLRKLEHHQKIIERALFPDEDTSTDVSGISHKEKQKYFQAIERINSELTGFQPIESDSVWTSRNGSGVTTPDKSEITGDEYY